MPRVVVARRYRRGVADVDGALVGFVLAGGGFKGAFEVGALQVLVGTHALVPDVITATSAGAVLGTVLAQGRTLAECDRLVEVAKGDLMAMTDTSRVFSEQPWLAGLDGTSMASRIHALVTEHGRPYLDDDWDQLEASAVTDLEVGGVDDGDTVTGPGRRSFGDHLHPFEKVGELVRTVRGDREHGVGRSVLTLDPFEESVRGGTDVGIAPLDFDALARPGVQLRLAVTALKARSTRYITQDGVLVDSDALTPVPDAHLDVIDGMIASASVPGVFPPREIGGELYVDGGCLQNIPLQAAVALGAERIFTLVACPVKPAKKTVSLWAAESLGYLSTQIDNLAVVLPDGVTNTVIEPTIDVVGSFEVHIGLMNIDIDYGNMRAIEVLSGLDDAVVPIATAASDSITRHRQLCWQLEDHALSSGVLHDDVLARLRNLKRSVRAGVEARSALGFTAPVGAERWSQTWELHATTVPEHFPTDLA